MALVLDLHGVGVIKAPPFFHVSATFWIALGQQGGALLRRVFSSAHPETYRPFRFPERLWMAWCLHCSTAV
jgi:hypothetical protein